MLYGKRIAVVLPAYNAARTLEKTVADIPRGVVDTILLVDDHSKDETLQIARRLGLRVFLHEFGRLRFRQRDAGAGNLFRESNRRSFLPHAILPGGIHDQFSPQRKVRVWSSLDVDPLQASEVRRGEIPDL
jgi:glycosyltransferase involved in cell wall biosynthesis